MRCSRLFPQILCNTVALLLLGHFESSWATTISVTTTVDNGLGSLRAAINTANAVASPPRDTIVFAIPGGTIHTILLDSALAPVTDVGVVIDGYTHPGTIPNSLAMGNNSVLKVELRNVTVGTLVGISVQADSCTIRGLAICDWRYGIRLVSTAEDCVVEGNWLGFTASGSAPGNAIAGVAVDGSRNTIGGTLPAARNVASGNGHGVFLFPTAQYNTVEGNYIGTDIGGAAAVANVQSGIALSGADSNSIGGSSPGTGNLISGNGAYELIMQAGAVGNSIAGNVIGLDASGSNVLAVANYGIELSDGSGNTIGGTVAGARNTITGFAVCNVFFQNDATKFNRVQGNLIGSDSSGLVALSNPGVGIGLVQSDSNTVGGMTAADRNYFVGLDLGAVQLLTGAQANLVVGNWVGLNTAGTALGNGFTQIYIQDSWSNQIGTTDWASGNVIANSAISAVRVVGTSAFNSILSNSVYSNGALALDLAGDGVTANDSADGDTGPNGLQNYPVLEFAHASAGQTIVQGTLNTTPNEPFLIQVFANAVCASPGYGEGATLCDSFTISTNVFGICIFNHGMLVDPPVGVWLTATATSQNGETSEFSPCEQVTPPPVDDTLRFFLFSPVDMVVTDPMGDSIGIDAATDTVFNTVQSGSTYDTTTNAGGSSESDDVITVPHPLVGNYRVRIFREDGVSDSATFTTAIRIDGNQMLFPEGYQDVAVSALGTTIPDTVIWTAAQTLPGDANADGSFTSADLIYLVNYIFKSGPGPMVTGHGDVNCSSATNSADIIYMVNFIFKGGLPPCSHSGG